MATAQGRRGPPAALVSLGDAERAILAACGLQPELAYGGGQAAALREAYRQFVHLSVAPIGRAVAAELALKLEVPGLAFDWSGLMAADVASKARAFQALTGAGMNTKAAAAAAGLEVWRWRERLSARTVRPSSCSHSIIRGMAKPASGSAGATLRPWAWTGASGVMHPGLWSRPAIGARNTPRRLPIRREGGA